MTADRPALRRTLAGMGTVMAANTCAGSWYALAGAKDWPVEWLRGTPFRDYRVPGAILGAVVGGSQALAAAALWCGHRHARRAALAAAAILLGWIVAQLALIGYVSPLQPIVLGWALVSGALATQLAR